MGFLKWLKSWIPRKFETRVSVAAFLFLLIAYIIIWILRWWQRTDVALNHTITGWRIFGEVLLVFLVPICLYFALRTKPTAKSGEFPDIDRAWEAGIDALEEAGIPISSRPLFLICGLASHDAERKLMTSAVPSLVVQGVPHETNIHFPLQWYVSAEGIYLMLSDDFSGTAEAAGSLDTNAPTGSGNREAFATMEPTRSDSVSSSSTEPVIAGRSMTELVRRLGYVGALLRDHRRPWCGANGMILFVSYAMLMNQRTEAGLQLLTKRIVTKLTQEMRLQVPISVVVNGMEDLNGFNTFTEQLAAHRREGELGRRFGAGFEIGWKPTRSVLGPDTTDVGSIDATKPKANLTDEVFHNVEDWVYHIYSQSAKPNVPSMLQQPRESRKLYEFLVRARLELRPKLSRFLRGAFGKEKDNAKELPPFFAGCYLASLSQDTGVFLRGVVLDKLLSEQAQVQWLRRARIINWFRWGIAAVGWVVAIAVATLLVGTLFDLPMIASPK